MLPPVGVVLRVPRGQKMEEMRHLIMDSCLGDLARRACETHSILCKKKGGALGVSPLGALRLGPPVLRYSGGQHLFLGSSTRCSSSAYETAWNRGRGGRRLQTRTN